jgi:NtrC-family two-component system response regulator AlgB
MRVLIVDDEPSIRRTTRIAVESAGHAAVEAPNAARAMKAAEDEGFDVVFLDLKLGADDGLEVLNRLVRLKPSPAVVMFTAYANIATAVEAMRRGAFDFIPKPFTPDQIRAVLAKVSRANLLERRVEALENDLASGAPPVDLESAEPSMVRAVQIAFKAAETDANMLILGASGTGKSVLAREIHKRSARKQGAFVTVNCPRASSSGTPGVPSPGRLPRRRARLPRPTGARSSWTRSARCPPRSSRSCSACSRNASMSVWVRRYPAGRMSA